MEELKSIMLKFVASDWDLLSVPAQQRLDGKADKGAFFAEVSDCDGKRTFLLCIWQCT